MIDLSIYDPIRLGNDLFHLRKDASEASALAYIFNVTVSPRSDQYLSWFRHNSPITYLPLNGAVLLDVESKVSKVEVMTFFDVDAGRDYRFLGLQAQPLLLLAFFTNPQTIEDWRAVAGEVNLRATTGRDGITRFK
jgi:hypothetical protein